MKKIFPMLLIGFLSVFFAEIFSGASQTWFIELFGIVLLVPLYMSHLLFFLWIGLKKKRTSITQLYLFGVLFGLYEAVITKVLWAGYMGDSGPALGTFLGLTITETPILIFFWHPIMSFIVPILVYEILTKKAIITHNKILEKSTMKTILIILSLIIFSSFIASGNGFSFGLLNSSVLGTIALIGGAYYFAKKSDLKIFELTKKGFIVLTSYLILLYVITFFFFLPERIPQTITPYASVLFFYLITIFLIIKSAKTETTLKTLNNKHYSIKDLIMLGIVLVVCANLSCIYPPASMIILTIGYVAFSIGGIILFLTVSYKIIKACIRERNKMIYF